MHVLISGAGIAGPALAFWLAKAGIDVTIVEKAPQLLATGQNIDISGSARRVIHKMGLTDQVRAKNTTEEGTQFIGPDGKPFALLPVKPGQTGASPTSEFEILRGDLSSILYDATKNNPRITYVFDTVIDQVLENSDRCVRVKLSNGDIQEYDVLCAADGQWSKVRKMCFPASATGVVDKDLYCAYWTCPRTNHDNRFWNIYIELGSRGVNIRPDPYGTLRACVTRMPLDAAHKDEWERASRANRANKILFLKKEFSDAGWETQRLLDGLDQAGDFYFQAIKQIRMKSWAQGRVICLGDTAYAPTPLTGMGTSLAITGAYVLAGELSNLSPDSTSSPSPAFEHFEAIFRPFVEKVQNIPFFIPAIVHPATAWKRWILQSIIMVGVRIANISWVQNCFTGLSDKEDFKLPRYPKFEAATLL